MQKKMKKTKVNDGPLRPFKEQAPFLWNDKTYYAYISGVGAGKTVAGIIRAGLNAEHWNPGEMGAIVAPTTTMIKDVILPLMRDAGFLDRWEYKSPHTDEPGLHVPNGGRILLLSADNRRTIERLAGLNLAWWWIDEATRVEERAHEILTQRLRVGQYRNGFITTTPKGQDYIYREFYDDIEGELQQYGEADLYVSDDRLAILRVPTYANPHTPSDFKDQVEKDHEGQVYEQEILGKFVQFEGLVYPWFTEDNLVDEAPTDYNEVIYGVDWGHNNPSAILAITVEGDTYTVVDEFYERRCTVNDLAMQALEMQERWGPGRFYCDPSEPANIDVFQRDDIDARPAENDVTPGIQHVSSKQDDLRVVRRCQAVRNEFGQYQYRDDDDDRPLKQNDHAMDALRYAVFTHEEGPQVTRRKARVSTSHK